MAVRREPFIFAAAVGSIAALAAFALNYYDALGLSKSQAIRMAGLVLNYFSNPTLAPGKINSEVAGELAASPTQGGPVAAPALDDHRPAEDWPSYNRTPTSERYSQIAEINAQNVHRLKVSCTYDT